MVKVLFDTSVLVAALVVSHPRHGICFPHLKAAESRQVEGFISTHTLAETYSVLTRLPIQPRLTPAQAQSITTDISQQLNIIPLFSEDYLAAISRMATINLPGGGIFDALIAQAALKAKVDILLTLNPNHFTRLGDAIATLVCLQRCDTLELLKDNPSLKPYLEDALVLAYENGRDLAMGETDLPEKTFPQTCPYSLAEILDDKFYPGEPSELVNELDR